MNIEEYVPIAAPIVSAKIKKKMLGLPNINTAIKASNVEMDVFNDLASVSLSAIFALSLSDLFAW